MVGGLVDKRWPLWYGLPMFAVMPPMGHKHLGKTALENLRDFLSITEAAEYLGVSPNTLRNWENAGKIEAHQHPVNGYRLFKQKELDALLKQLNEPKPPPQKKRYVNG